MKDRTPTRFRSVTFQIMATKTPKKPPRKYSSDPKTRAAELVAEGKLGGRREGAGRPRKVSPETQSHPRPASAHMAAGIAELGPQMLGVIRDVLEDDTASDGAKLRALKAAVGIELKETELQLEESKRDLPSPPPEFENREDALSALAAKLAENPILRDRLLAAVAPRPPVTGQ